jgi:pimeloyl-ACP methyl ester carboxylesterase
MLQQPTVHYCHGLESGPRGFKARKLSEHFQVTSPDMKMSLWNPFAENSLVRNLFFRLRFPPSHALFDSFEGCLDIQRLALATRDHPPDVLVGSSWGGGIAAALLAEGAYRGPFVLLCPAIGIREQWVGMDATRPSLSLESISENLASLPDEIKMRGLLVHGTKDGTVPIEHTRALSERIGVELLEVEDGSHGLGAWTASEGLRDAVRRVLRNPTGTHNSQ